MQLQPTLLWGLFKDTFSKWNRDDAPRLGAALAYYTVFSIVPLLVVIIAIVGLIFGQEAAQSYILEQIKALIGDQSAETLKEMLQHANKPSTGMIATVVGIITLLLGASGFFGQLQAALNEVWGVEPKPGRGILGMLKDRFFSFLAVLGTGFLLAVSLVLSAGLSALGKLFEAWLPLPEGVLQGFNFLFSLAVITVLFAMIFKLLPDAEIAWSDVWIGAAMTSLLFTIGKFLIGFYLGKSDVGSAYGAAGSLVIILVWVYYSAQILLFGAEFTEVYAKKSGSRIVPSGNATAVADKETGPAFGKVSVSARRPTEAPRHAQANARPFTRLERSGRIYASHTSLLQLDRRRSPEPAKGALV